MTRIDQFESLFKAAVRTPFTYERVEVERVLVVSDLPEKDAAELRGRLRQGLAALGEGAQWIDAAEGRGRTVGELLEVVEAERPQLVCTYRSLYSEGWRWPFSLGEHLDVLTQATTTPVLVLPRPERAEFWERRELGMRSVMAITDHLAGDARLVRWAARFTAPGGRLHLTHIEDEAVFRRYVDDVISRIPAIDTDAARELIRRQLLKEPAEYIASCRQVLAEEGLPLSVEKVVELGHHLAQIRHLVEDRRVDLLVLNTKDEDQQAMHGLAYPIAVELRSTPLLML